MGEKTWEDLGHGVQGEYDQNALYEILQELMKCFLDLHAMDSLVVSILTDQLLH